MNLKTSAIAPVIVLALLPLATRAQTTPTPANSALPRFDNTFTSPLKIVGADGHFTVTPRGSSTVWSCPEGQPTQINVGSPVAVVYTLSPDGNVITALANGGSLKVDVAKAQYATAKYGDPVDSAPMQDFAKVGSAPTLFGTSPTALSTGFELLYSAAAGLTVSVMTGQRTLGAFTASGTKWQLGFFPLDDAQSAAATSAPAAPGATAAPSATPPPPRGDVIITGAACKGSPVQSASIAK